MVFCAPSSEAARWCRFASSPINPEESHDARSRALPGFDDVAEQGRPRTELRGLHGVSMCRCSTRKLFPAADLKTNGNLLCPMYVCTAVAIQRSLTRQEETIATNHDDTYHYIRRNTSFLEKTVYKKIAGPVSCL